MGRIGFLLIEVLPPALVVTLILWIKYHKTLKIFIGYSCFSIYLCAVYALTGLPTIQFLRFDLNLSLIPFIGIIGDFKNALLNILLFLPLGFLLPIFWTPYRTGRKTIGFGFGMSLMIELLQIFTFRATDINDIITNTLGTVLGFLTVRLLLRRKVLPANHESQECFFLFSITGAIMFFVQPLISTVIWKYLL